MRAQCNNSVGFGRSVVFSSSWRADWPDRFLLPLLAAYSLTTLLIGIPGFTLLNRFLVLPVIALIAIALFKGPTHSWAFVALSLLVAVWFVACAFTEWFDQPFTQAPRSIFCVMVLTYFVCRFDKAMELLKVNWRFYQIVLTIWTIAVAVSIPMSSSWQAEWGGDVYFTSWCSSAFELMPTAMLVMSMNMLCASQGQSTWKTLALSAIPLWAGVQGGSRTYFVLVVFMFVILLRELRLTGLQKCLIVTFSLVMFFNLVLDSGLVSKITFNTSEQARQYIGGDVVSAFTSGRSDFWVYDIQAFFSLNIPQQFVGNGFSFSYLTNSRAVGLSIYAHNDFINFLMELGYVGLLIYLGTIIAFFRTIVKKGTSSGPVVLLVFVWVFNAFINCFYTYASSVISLCFAGVALVLFAENNRSNSFHEEERSSASGKSCHMEG